MARRWKLLAGITSPDPGEEYQHVNTQLFGLIDPPGNRGQPPNRMTAPCSAPDDPARPPTMDGFVADFISTFTAELGRPPGYDEYAQIMTGYTPAQLPVTSGLARGFATFDHWFCDVPSQTFANRSFFHAASSSGYVVNVEPAGSFAVHNRAETIFERLESHGQTWRVYCDPPSHISLTGIIHAPRLHGRTLRERWGLGGPLTGRDAVAAGIAPVLTLDRPRPPEEWPDAVPLPVPPFRPQAMPGDVPLRALSRAALLAVMEVGKRLGLRVPDLDKDAAVLRSDGMALVNEYFSEMFPHLRGE